MFRPLRQFTLVSSLMALPLGAAAIEPVKHIAVYVQPYYDAAKTPEGRPRVAVAKKYDSLLSSSQAADIAAARDQILADSKLLTPMTLMVLAIRLYDVGLRDDSVFWFYAAKNRYVTVEEVLDVRSPALQQVEQATRDFATLAGPVINGYAFCDVKKQQAAQRRALEWVERHPYEALFLPQVPARPGDRQAKLQAALAKLRQLAQQEAQYLAKPENLARLAKTRQENGADKKFCW